MQTYSQQIIRRKRLWWDRPQLTEVGRYRDAIHRLGEQRTLRSRDDPDQAWRCCPFWPRTLVNKWNGREFAARHGSPVPELYWRGFDPSRAPIEALPIQFVVRPAMGTGRRGVLVVDGERELLRDESISLSGLREKLPRPGSLPPRMPILIEEFVRSEQGDYELPLEFKCHTFDDRVAAVQVIARFGPHRGKHRLYTTDWEPWSDQFNFDMEQDEVIREPPRCLDQMLEIAAKLGPKLGTYMRIDFFATDRGCVFNEFSSVPGEGIGFTPYCDELLGGLWAEKFPDAT